jgi:hypothetical protein
MERPSNAPAVPRKITADRTARPCKAQLLRRRRQRMRYIKQKGCNPIADIVANCSRTRKNEASLLLGQCARPRRVPRGHELTNAPPLQAAAASDTALTNVLVASASEVLAKVGRFADGRTYLGRSYCLQPSAPYIGTEQAERLRPTTHGSPRRDRDHPRRASEGSGGAGAEGLGYFRSGCVGPPSKMVRLRALLGENDNHDAPVPAAAE